MPKAEKTKPVSLRELRKTFRKFLEEYDITLAEFGGYAGLSKGMLSLFMSGKRDLSREAWVRVVVATRDLPKLQTEIARRKAEDGAKRAAGTAAKLGVPRGALHAALGAPLAPEKQELVSHVSASRIYRLENSQNYWVKFFVSGRTYLESAETESHSEAIDFLWKRIEEELRESREQQKRQLAALENLTSIDDPVISELIESFRRELGEKDKQIEEMNRALVKNGRAATT